LEFTIECGSRFRDGETFLYVKLSKNSKDYGEPDITYQLAGNDKLGFEGNTLPDVFYIENK